MSPIGRHKACQLAARAQHVFKTTDTVQNIVLLLLVYLLSYLVSIHRYLSFKHMDIAKEKRFQLFIG